MSKKILIDTSNTHETRIAVTEDGKLDDFEIEPNKKNAVKGDVYLAKITRVEPSLQAAFVDFGANRNGFLPLTEIHPDYFKIPSADQNKLEELIEKQSNEDNLDDTSELNEPVEKIEEDSNEELEAHDDKTKNLKIKNLIQKKNTIIFLKNIKYKMLLNQDK